MASSVEVDHTFQRLIAGKLFTIRKATKGDIEPLFLLANQVYTDEISISPLDRIPDGVLDTANRYPQSYDRVLVIEADDKIVGLLQFTVYFNLLQNELVVENDFIVVKREFRSYPLFRMIISAFESISHTAKADRLIVGYDTGSSAEQKRELTYRLRFEVVGAILVKEIKAKNDLNYSSLPKLSLSAVKFYNRNNKLNAVDAMLFFLGTWASLREAHMFGQRFLEIGPNLWNPKRFLSARTLKRKPDGVTYVFADGISHADGSCLRKLEQFAEDVGARYISINLTSTYGDAAKAFPDYEDYGYRKAGYVLSKSGHLCKNSADVVP